VQVGLRTIQQLVIDQGVTSLSDKENICQFSVVLNPNGKADEKGGRGVFGGQPDMEIN